MNKENVNIKEDNITKKKKTQEEIMKENSSLMDAFRDPSEDNIIEEEDVSKKMDPNILAALKAKMSKIENKKAEVPMAELVDEKEVSINIGVIGVGQAGSRIAEQFHKLGYDVGVINTSAQDLRYIDVLDSQKLLLEGSLGGTGKDLDLGREIFSDNYDKCSNLVDEVSEGNDMLFLAMSGGGGTGSSSVDTMVDICSSTGMPLGLIYILPKATEDAQSKKNSVESLARLARLTADDKISCLIVVDNARIEQIYGGLSQSQFWNTSNNAIVEPIHLFNKLTSEASMYTSLDPSDFGKIISCGDCTVYGMVEVNDYMDTISIAEAMMDSLNSNMLADGFDLKQTRVGGAIIVGSQKVLDELPAINIDYAFEVISDNTDKASIYRGVYAQEGITEGIRVYTWFAGLGLPQDRIESLKKESKEASEIAAAKEGRRPSSMTLDLEQNKTSSLKDEIHRKIKGKKSGFGKLQGGARRSLIDRRRGGN
jgi:tubulin-like protein CetZ